MSDISKNITWVYDPNLCNSATWTSNYVMINEQSSLFDKQEIAEIEAHVEILSNACTDLHTIVSVLSNTYKKMWPSMWLFFYKVKDNRKVLLHRLHALPFLFFSIHDISTRTIGLKLICHARAHNKNSWDDIPAPGVYQDEKTFIRTDMKYFFHYIKNIKAYRWGFQIITEENYNCICVHNNAILNSDDQEKDCTDWKIPFKSSLREEDDMKKIIAEYNS